MNAFSSKVVLVTGAGQGIGFEIARQFCNEGAQVLINDVDEKLCLKSATSIDPQHKTCMAIPGDAGDLDYITQTISMIDNQFGQLDVVVANAGISHFGKFLSTTPEDLDKMIQLNVKGTFFLFQQAAQLMVRRGIKGRLIAMSSVVGRRAHEELVAYGMTKAALEALVRNLVIEISEYGITANAVAPGATLTERTETEKDYGSVWSKLTPLGKPATPAQIADLVLFLASEKANLITGQTIVVDGGWSSISPGPEYVR